MVKSRESSTDKDYMDLPGFDVPDTTSIKKTPNWVTLAQLDGPVDDSLINKLAYKPALRFHGLGGGLWGQQGISAASSVASDSRPPSYRVVEAIKARESCNTCDHGSTSYKNANMTAVSPLTLRRRNTVAVVVVAIALLAAVATITGLILHFLHPKAMLRANVRFTIANQNFTDEMLSDTSREFSSIARPLCKEMDVYFLTSELADFYLGCNVVTLSDDTSAQGIAVHHTLDFIDNKVSNDGDRIKNIILRKSGRLKSNDTLYMVVRDFHIYLRSLRIDLERLPFPAGHPSRYRPSIPWNDDFIPRKSDKDKASIDVTNSVLTDADTKLTPRVLSELTRFNNKTIVAPGRVPPLEIYNDDGAKHSQLLLGRKAGRREHMHSVVSLDHAKVFGIATKRPKAVVVTAKSSTQVNTLWPNVVTFSSVSSVSNGDGPRINPTKASSMFTTHTRTSNMLLPIAIETTKASVFVFDTKQPEAPTDNTKASVFDTKQQEAPNDNTKASVLGTKPPEAPNYNTKASVLGTKQQEAPNYNTKAYVLGTKQPEAPSDNTQASVRRTESPVSNVIAFLPNPAEINVVDGVQSSMVYLNDFDRFRETASGTGTNANTVIDIGGFIPGENSNTNEQNRNIRIPYDRHVDQNVDTRNRNVHIPIEASFSDINDFNDYLYQWTTETPGLTNQNTLNQDNPDHVSSKMIYTLFSDVFLIMGSSIASPDVPATLTPTAHLAMLPTPTAGSPETLAPTSVNTQPTTTGRFQLGDQATATQRLPTGLPHFVSIPTPSYELKLSKAPELKEFQHAVSWNLDLVPAVRPSTMVLGTPSASASVHTGVGNAPPVLKEVVDRVVVRNIDMDETPRKRNADVVPPVLNEVVEIPVKETPIADGIQGVEWVNVFNDPRRTQTMLVGEVAGVADIPASIVNDVVGQHSGTGIGEIQGFQVQNKPLGVGLDGNIADGISHLQDGFGGNDVFAGGNGKAPLSATELASSHHEKVMRFFDKLMGDDVNTDLSTGVQISNNVNRNMDINHDQHIPPPSLMSPEKLHKLIPGYYPLKHGHKTKHLFQKQNQLVHMQPGDKFAGDTHPFQVPFKKPLFKSPGVKRFQGLQNIHTNKGPYPLPTVKLRPYKNAMAFVGKPLPFKLRPGKHNGVPALMLTKSSSPQVTRVQQPWSFLNQIGFNANKRRYSQQRHKNKNNFPKSGYIKSKSVSLGNNNYNNLRQQFQTKSRSSRTYLVQSGSHGYGLNEVSSWGKPSVWRTLFRFKPKLYSGASATSLSNYGGVSAAASASSGFGIPPAGLPRYEGFEDISMMKHILADLVTNMINMTQKLDKMQDAIDFINKTFHETHEPMFQLEETLGNMTVSLGNMSLNLDNINQTLRSFKDFLNTFDNTVFNIDDVIKHIDDTIDHLGKAVRYVEYSLVDLNGTTGVNGALTDIETALKLMDKSVFDVNYSSVYSNETLGSMKDTLESLENAVFKLNIQVSEVVGGSDVISVSLKDINTTVINTHGKLNGLHGKLQKFNKSMSEVSTTVSKLNETYFSMNETLSRMNESFVFVNGTVLGVIQQLTSMNGKLNDLNGTVMELNSNMTRMNVSLLNSMKWVRNMVDTLVYFNTNVKNDTIQITVSLQNKDLIQTIGMLIEMNGTLTDIGNDVGVINIELDKMDLKLDGLAQRLSELDNILGSIEVAFKVLNKTIKLVNATVNETTSSLGNMDVTVEKINTTIADMSVSFGNINETLNVVNNTIAMVNRTAVNVTDKLKSVEKTFGELIQSTRVEIDSTFRLKDNLARFEGQSSALNSRLYNANETLRIVRSKSDIMDESYRILYKTLVNTEAIVAELQTKLVETVQTMDKTNDSIGSVNESLSAVDFSQEELNSQLRRLMKSFDSMNYSLKDVGSAFPNMIASINTTKHMINDLQGTISVIKNNFTTGVATRDVLNHRYLQLNSILKTVTGKIDTIATHLDGIKTTSQEALREVTELKTSVNETKAKYDTVEKNVKYINMTHDKLYNSYNALQMKRIEAEDNINNTTAAIRKIEAEFKGAIAEGQKYKKLNSPFVKLQEQFIQTVKDFEMARDEFANWTGKFEALDGVLWRENGSPNSVYVAYDELVSNTTFVNGTMAKYTALIAKVAEAIGNITTFEKKGSTAIDKANTNQQYLDDIEANKTALENKITDVEAVIDQNRRKIESMIDGLKTKLAEVEKMRAKYGDVNGTLNNTKVYDEMINDIKAKINKLENILGKLDVIGKLFNSTVDGFKALNDKYRNSTFDLTPESEELLKSILGNMQDTNISLSDLISSLSNLTQSVDGVEKTLVGVNDAMSKTEKELQYQKKKNEYVKTTRPKILTQFNETVSRVNKTVLDGSKLINRIESLKKTATDILAEGKMMLYPNVNIDVTPEESMLDTLESELTKTINETKTTQDKLLEDYTRLKSMNEANFSLAEIKSEYKLYNDSVNMLDDVITKSVTSMESTSERLWDISHAFDDLIRLIDILQDSYVDMEATNGTLSALSDNITEVAIILSEAEVQLSLVQTEFHRIQQNYTNFTATDVDLSASYVHEALTDDQNLLKVLLDEFSGVQDAASRIVQKSLETRNTLIKKPLHRHNIDSTLGLEVTPSIKHINSKASEIGENLTSIVARVKELTLSVSGINDTIGATNSQLFTDRQKQLLANTVFPKINEQRERINTSLNDADQLLDDTTTKLEDAMKIFNLLDGRLTNFPNSNISVNDIKEMLERYNRTLRDAANNLTNSRQQLLESNNTLWQGDERYTANESIADMKTRYAKVKDILKQLTDGIAELEKDIDVTLNGTTNATNQLIDVNKALTQLEQTHTELDRVENRLKSLKDMYNNANNTVRAIEANTSHVRTVFDALKLRFENISATVLRNHTNPFDVTLSATNADVSNISADVSNVYTTILNAQQLIAQTHVLRNATIADKVSLDDVNKKQMESMKAIEPLLDDIEANLQQIIHKSEPISSTIHDMRGEVDKMTNIFTRQEKQEYYDVNFPGERFNGLRRTFDDLESSIVALEKRLQKVNNEFTTLQNESQDVTNLQFNTNVVNNSLEDINSTVADGKAMLGQVLVQYRDVEPLLTANDNNLISDNETLEYMKLRYAKLEGILNTIDASVNGTKSSLLARESQLTNDNVTIGVMMDTVRRFKETINQLRQFSVDVNSLVKHVESTAESNNQRELHYVISEERFDSLLTSFPNTTNGAIEISKEQIVGILKSQKVAIVDVLAATSASNTSLANSRDTLHDYTDTIMQSYSNPGDITKHLKKFDALSNVVKVSIDNASVVKTHLDANTSSIDQQNLRVVKYLDRLHAQLKAQEKEDFLKKNIPILLEFLNKVTRMRNKTVTTLANTDGRLKPLKALTEDVSVIIGKEDTIRIPLNVTYDKQGQWSDILVLSNDDVNSASDQLASLDNSMLGENSGYFKSNDSISHIKDAFTRFKGNLKHAFSAYQAATSNATKIDADVTRDERYLNEVITESNRLATIKREVNSTEQMIDDLQVQNSNAKADLNAVNANLQEINEMLSEIASRFKKVQDVSLQAELSALIHNRSELTTDNINLHREMASIETKLAVANETAISLATIVANVSESLPELSSKNTEAEDVHTIIKGHLVRLEPMALDTFSTITQTLDNVVLLNQQLVSLTEEFRRRQIYEYAEDNIPKLLEGFGKLNRSVSDIQVDLPAVSADLSKLNDTLDQVKVLITSEPNIQINMDKRTNTITNQHSFFRELVTGSNETLTSLNTNMSKLQDFQQFVNIKFGSNNNTMDGPETLATNLSNNHNWGNLTISDVEVIITGMQNDTIAVADGVASLNSSLASIRANISVQERDLLETKTVVETFKEMSNQSNTAGDNLNALQGNVTSVNDLLAIAQEKLTNNTHRLNALTSEFLDVTNPEIVSLVQKVRSTLEESVDPRLQSAQNLIHVKLNKKYNEVKTRLDDVTSLINKTHTDRYQLESDLGEIEAFLANITTDASVMNDDERNVRSDLETNLSLLNDSNALLDEIEYLFRSQKKLDILNSNIPVLQQSWDHLAGDINGIGVAVHLTNSTISETGATLVSLEGTITGLPSVNISTAQQRKEVSDGYSHVDLVTNHTRDLNASLHEMNISGIDIDALVQDRGVGIDEVEMLMSNINKSLVISKAKADEIKLVIDLLERNLTGTSTQLTLLNETLSSFTKVKNDLKETDDKYKEVDKMKNITDVMLSEVNEQLLVHQQRLKSLQNNYKAYIYNDAQIEELLKASNATIQTLAAQLANASGDMINVHEVIQDTNTRMYASVNDRGVLNSTLVQVRVSNMETVTRLQRLNTSFNDILNNMPKVNITIQQVASELTKMDKTLRNEEKKSSYQGDVLPTLEEKYNRVEFTFDTTNTTLQKMADEIGLLSTIVTKLRKRMDGIQTINISMSDMDANITHLEDRLTIMKDSYNNVQEILNTLRGNLELHSVLGQNVSLDDVHTLYGTFNDSLDMAVDVLGKIESETYEMSNSFDVLNDTVVNINTALDSFDTNTKQTELMSKNINTLADQIGGTVGNISQMEGVVKNLTASFDEMQRKYKAVFNKTAENNTAFTDMLSKAGKMVADIGSFMNDIQQRFNTSAGSFSNMNNTLFSDINTYIDLTATLMNVKDSYADISSSLDALEHGIIGAAENTTGVNSEITKLTTLLDGLDDNLRLEQLKYDFLQTNFGDLEGKVNGLESPVQNTNQTINDVSDTVTKAFDQLKKLTEKMKGHPNIQISLSEDLAHANRLNDTVDKTLQRLNELHRQHQALKDNVTSLTDSTGNVTEVQTKFKAINQSLDQIRLELLDMYNDLMATKNGSGNITFRANELSVALDDIGALTKGAEREVQNVQVLAEEVKNTTDMLSESNKTVLNLQDDLRQMNTTLAGIDDPRVHTEYSDLLANVSEKRLVLKKLEEAHFNLSSRIQKANSSVMDTNADLLKKILSTPELLDVLKKSNTSLQDIANETKSIDDLRRLLEKESIALKNEIDALVNEAQLFNDTLMTEKGKRDYINKMLPVMKNKFSQLENLMKDSNKSIGNIYSDINTTDAELDSLRDRMESVKSINIPLNDEFMKLKQLQDRLGKTNRNLFNISEFYDAFDVDRLRNTNLSFTELKQVYENFERKTKELKDGILQVNTASQEILDGNAHLKNTINDVNTTMDHYMEVKEKLDSTHMSGKVLSERIALSNDTITEMTKQLQNLDDTFTAISRTFTHVKDKNVLQAKASLEKLIGASKTQLTTLQDSLSNISQGSNNTGQDISVMNDTLASTKALLNQLKDHIQTVNASSTRVQSDIDKLNDSHNSLNNSVGGIPPALKQILDQLSTLNNTYVNEHEKLSYIGNNKPSLDKRLADLQKFLADTNTKLSLTEVQLTDLKYSITVKGEGLAQFKILNFTTDPEQKIWVSLNDETGALFKLFTNVSGDYSDLQLMVATLEDRSSTMEAIKKKYEQINTTLAKLEAETAEINRQIDTVKVTTNATEETLEGFVEIMETLSNVTQLATETGGRIGKLGTTSKALSKQTQIIEDIINGISSELNAMKVQYAPLANKDWEIKHKQFTDTVNKELGLLTTANSTYVKLANQLRDVATAYNATNSKLVNDRLTRVSANASINRMLNEIQDVSSNVTKLTPGFTEIQKHHTKQAADFDAIQAAVKKLNESLFSELQKHNFINEYLPPTQDKHTTVNTSFVANIPEIERMKKQIENLVTIITKIKEKLMIFGLPQDDQSIRIWDSRISSLNNKISTIMTNNNKSAETLKTLQRTLWSQKPMYSKQETLVQLTARFESYNVTLDEIHSSAHSIQITLGKVAAETTDTLVELTDRDSMLTTTPATTTPSGPPDWLTFTSSATGVIGKDSGFAKCSVGNSDQWKLMRISRLMKDGREPSVALWMTGKGARKAVRERRISVRKVDDVNGGGSMEVQIKSLQCKDEGTYYCSIDSYDMWPLETTISVTNPPENNIKPNFPTEVFEDKLANFSCMGHPGYPSGRLIWKVKHQNDKAFKPFTFYSARSTVSDSDCVRTEMNKVEYVFNMSWNNSRIRCYIDNTDYYAEDVIRLLPYDVCNNVRYEGFKVHPYTPHKYIVCGKELNIMECPGNTCYDEKEENCVSCKATHRTGDPCQGQPMYSYVAHETDCRKYYICLGPTKKTKACSVGYFQPKIAGYCVSSYAQSHCGQTKG